MRHRLVRRHRLPDWVLLLVLTLVLVGGPSGIVWALYFGATSDPAPAAPATAADPLELTIESLGIRNVEILPLALQAGVLRAPDNPRLVGWWNASADVGADAGTTLLTSHKVADGSGVFERLVDVAPGAQIVVSADTGSYRYVVTEVRVLHKDQLAVEAPELFDQQGPHRLVLVTCEDWDGTGFASNSVVVATPTPDPVAG